MQEAYGQALNGDSQKDQSTGGPVRQGGCFGEATYALDKTAELVLDPEIDALLIRIRDLDATISGSQAWGALDEQWSDCMASAGHTFATSDDASISISEELHELTSSLDPFRGKDAGDSEDLTEEQIRFIEDPASILSEKQRTALSEKEIALATDDLHCRQTTHLREQRDKLRFDVEVRFAEENKAELSAMKAAYERAGG